MGWAGFEALVSFLVWLYGLGGLLVFQQGSSCAFNLGDAEMEKKARGYDM